EDTQDHRCDQYETACGDETGQEGEILARYQRIAGQTEEDEGRAAQCGGDYLAASGSGEQRTDQRTGTVTNETSEGENGQQAPGAAGQGVSGEQQTVNADDVHPDVHGRRIGAQGRHDCAEGQGEAQQHIGVLQYLVDRDARFPGLGNIQFKLTHVEISVTQW